MWLSKSSNQTLELTATRRVFPFQKIKTVSVEAALALMRSLPFTCRYPRALPVYPPASQHGVFVSGCSAFSR
jgi:hypothetical protein